MINNLNSNLLKIINNHAPFIEKKVKIRKHLVVNYEIIEARRFKRKIERKYRKTLQEKDKQALKNAQKTLNKKVMQCNNDYFKNKFESCKGNIKETYKIIYNLLNRNEKNTLTSHFN